MMTSKRSIFPCVPFSLVVLILKYCVVLAVSTSNHSLKINETSPRSPPPKTLFNSQFTQDNIRLMKTNQFPLRESYIAYEQAHPSEQDFDQYFKPSKFPSGFDNDGHNHFVRMPNTIPFHHHHTPMYAPPPPPPPPPPPFLRLVRIPGELKINVNIGGSNDLEVICEFPQFLILVQQIYWHVIPPPNSLLLPYGTFYDSRNGFAPRVTVHSISKWKSVLRVRDYSPDDYGTYRCVSTAILPDEPEPNYSRLPPPPPPPSPTTFFLNYPHESLELRSSASTPISSQEDPDISSRITFRSKREIGAFGVYAPFYKPRYGIYRVYKEIYFNGDIYRLSSSEVVENTIAKPEKQDRDGDKGEGNNRIGRRRVDLIRKSKVLFK